MPSNTAERHTGPFNCGIRSNRVYVITKLSCRCAIRYLGWFENGVGGLDVLIGRIQTCVGTGTPSSSVRRPRQLLPPLPPPSVPSAFARCRRIRNSGIENPPPHELHVLADEKKRINGVKFRQYTKLNIVPSFLIFKKQFQLLFLINSLWFSHHSCRCFFAILFLWVFLHI